jgi:hypothetical protein
VNTCEQENECEREQKQDKLVLVAEIGCELELEVRKLDQDGDGKNRRRRKEEKKKRKEKERRNKKGSEEMEKWASYSPRHSCVLSFQVEVPSSIVVVPRSFLLLLFSNFRNPFFGQVRVTEAIAKQQGRRKRQGNKNRTPLSSCRQKGCPRSREAAK